MNDIHLPFRLLHQLRASENAPSPRRSLRRTSRLLTLEQRFMFDGAAVATAADAAHAQADTHAAALVAEAAGAAHQVREADASRNSGKKEVVFVDTSVADYKTLEAGVRDGVAIVEFDGSKDGLAQIAQWAANQSGYDAIHILSHGSEGKLNLSTSPLTDASLTSETVQSELAEIGHALNAGGDLLLYGCDVAVGNDGQRFIDDLARLTGADVAASTNATGAIDKGGDWLLEAHVGKIDTDALHIDSYQELLTVQTFAAGDTDLADWDHTSITRTIDGKTFTLSGGGGTTGMGIDSSTYGSDGLYAYEGPGAEIKLTISVEPGYMFDLSSFNTGAASGSLTIALTYANGTTDSFAINSLNDSWQTLSSFSKPTNHVTQVVLSSSGFGLFQNFGIINVRAIPPVPTVSDANISITSAPTGTGATYKIGDTVTATWTNAAASEVDSVTMNFSQFGGGSAVVATNSGGVWTASYTITSGSIDATNRNVSVSAINAGGTTTVADTTNLSVDNTAPTVTNGNIGISGGTGPGGAYKIGDTVTASWNNTAGGDNNSDTLSSVTFDFSAFGGSSAVAGTNSGGTWTATYTITAGAIDATNRNVSVKVTDNAGNTTTTTDTANATVDNIAPTVTDANIGIGGGTGPGGAYKIGDTVSASWYNTAGGDNNSDTLSSVTFDFSAFGGSNAVTATNVSGVWAATYVITAGAIDATNRHVSVTVKDNAGNTTTTADTTNATVDNIAPMATDGNIGISGGTGPGGAYKIGDTVTASWNNTAGGDNNADTISGVTFDFSQFGGGSVVAATNSGGTWTATYTITAGAIDAINRNVSVKVTDNAGNTTTTADTTNATVDNIAPTVTDANIGISGGTGPGGAYKIGDTITASWNNTASGDNNADTISGVTFDFSQFGGGSAVAGTNSGGTWTATYTITAGAIDAINRNVSVKVTDNAGNTTTTADTTNATVDNIAPTVTDANIGIGGGTGPGGAYRIGDTVSASWNNTAGGDNNADTISGVTFDFSQFGGGSAVAATNSAGTWTATYTIVAGSIDGLTNRNVSVKVTDNAGNTTTTTDTTNATVDNVRPTTTWSGIALSADTGSSGSDFITNTASQTITATLSGALAGGDKVYGSLDNGATWTDITSKVSGTTLSWDGATLLGSHTIQLKVTDAAGNDGTVASQSYTLDTVAPSAPSAPDMTAGTDSGSSGSDNITSDTTPTFTGTAEIGSTVTLYDSDGITVLGTALATGDNWSITTSPLSAGAHTIVAIATDVAGNASVVSTGLAVFIDPTAPTAVSLSATDISSLGASSGSTVATLSSIDSNTVTYSLVAGNGSNDADNGSFSISGNSLRVGASSLAAGTYHIYVAATDTAGNVGYQAFTITVTDAPSVSSIVRTGGASAAVNHSATSVSYTVTFSEAVSGVDASDFTLSATGTASGSIVSISGSGATYTITVNSLAGDGTLRLDLNNSGTGIQNGSSVDIVGGYTSGAAYTLDHTVPAAPSAPDMSSGSDTGTSSTDNITSNTTPTFTGTAESGSTVTLYDTDGITVLGTTTASGGTWSITSSALSEGTHTVTAKATDAAGNVSSASSGLNFEVDTSAPAVVISSNVSTMKAGESATITFTFSEDPGATFTIGDISVSGGTLGPLSGSGLTRTATFTPTANTNGGTASITITAGSYADVAGNNGGGNALPSLTFDTLLPNAPSTPDMVSGTDTGISDTDNTTSNTAPTFTGTAENGSTVTLYDTDGTTVLGTAIATGGNWSITPGSPLSEGTHTITAKATDAAGNVSSASSGLTITIDTTAPTATVAAASFSADTGASSTDFITRTSAQTISGTLSVNLGSNETVEVSLDNGSTWHTATASAGSTSWSYSTTLIGSDTLKVRVVDAAGNIGTAYSHAYALDTVAPDVNSVTVPANGTYYTNQNIDFTVHFSEAVIVDTTGGTPRIALAIGATTVYATYQSGSGTSDLVFRYTVADGAQDNNGITVGALNANGGTLRDAAGNDATLTLNSVGSTAAVNVDGSLPRIIDVSSTTPNGSYKAGDTVTITVTFNNAVTVDTAGGTPTLALSSGGIASYTSGSGGTTLVFTYTVGAGQNTADLDYRTTGALALNGGTIKSGSGGHPDALITLQAPGTSGSLGANKDIVIDTTPPAAPTVEPINTVSLTPVLTGTATLDAGETLTVTVNGTTYHVTPSGGHWSLDLASAVPSAPLVLGGTYNVTATVTDAIGNTSSATSVLAIAAPPPPPPIVTSPTAINWDNSHPDAGTPISQPTLTSAVPPFVPPALDAVLRTSQVTGNTDIITAALFSLERGTTAPNGLDNGDRISQTLLTQGSSFRVVVLPASAGSEGLMLNRGIGDQSVQSSNHTEISIPPDAFAHTDPNAAIQLSARQPDGRPLPNWLRFDSRSGKFTIDAPQGMTGEIAVKVVARDSRGNEVATIFRIRVGDKGAVQPRPQAEPAGRAGLSEQIHQAARQRGNADALDRLAELAHAFQWPNS